MLGLGLLLGVVNQPLLRTAMALMVSAIAMNSVTTLEIAVQILKKSTA